MIQYLQMNFSEMNDMVNLGRFLQSRSHNYNSQFCASYPTYIDINLYYRVPILIIKLEFLSESSSD